jgi:hypothetical protein
MTVHGSADANTIDAIRTKRRDKNFLINSLSLWYKLGNVIPLFSLASEMPEKGIMQGRVQRRPAVKESVWLVFSSLPSSRAMPGGLGERRIVGAEEEGDKLFFYGEEDRLAVYQPAKPGQSITVKNQDRDVEFSG